MDIADVIITDRLPLVELDESRCGDGELRVEAEAFEEVFANVSEKLLAHPRLHQACR